MRTDSVTSTPVKAIKNLKTNLVAKPNGDTQIRLFLRMQQKEGKKILN
jgi:hypothetical protein